jgi:predicted RNA binding protein YcfA (HicA-like mRNA interferase family)
VPKLPRVSGAETVRRLERLGFAVVRQRGSHLVMRRGASGCVVPTHREMKVGTLAEFFGRPAFQLRNLFLRAEQYS